MTAVYLVAAPIGDYVQDMSVAAIHVLKKVRHVFVEADDAFLAKLRDRDMISAEHRVYVMDEPRIEEAKKLIARGESFAITASSGIPCFLDPGRDIVRLCLDEHLDAVELIPIGLSSALDAGLCMAGMDPAFFHFNGHYPEHYIFDDVMPANEIALIYFVRGGAIRQFVTEVSERVSALRRLVLLKDLRKKQRARVCVLHDLPADIAAVPADDPEADYVCVIDRTLPPRV